MVFLCTAGATSTLEDAIPISTPSSLTTDERSWAAEARSTIVEELLDMPTYLEAKVEQLPPGLRTVVERFLNSTSEMFWVMYNTIQDPVFREVAEKTARNMREVLLPAATKILSGANGGTYQLWVSSPPGQDRHI